jgi:glycosyltransferase involved in cell wall biosynthesis
VVGGDTETVTEFVTHRKTGLVTPTLDSKALARNVLTVLEDTRLAATLRTGARSFAEARLDLGAYLAHYRRVIEEIAGKPMIASAPAPAAKPAKRARRLATA